jgi:hypothetical protein
MIDLSPVLNARADRRGKEMAIDVEQQSTQQDGHLRDFVAVATVS